MARPMMFMTRIPDFLCIEDNHRDFAKSLLFGTLSG
jgi:hypothetical protein